MNGASRFSVASFNVHAGIDGWGRPFDAVGACAAMDADILVLEEDWIGDDPTESIADQVATRCGYRVISAGLGRARRRMPPEQGAVDSPRWAPRRSAPRPLRLEGPPRSKRARSTAAELALPTTPGTLATSLLSRLPILEHHFLELPLLRGDAAQRRAIIVKIDSAGLGALTVVGVHLGHLSRGSIRQMLVLRQAVRKITGPVLIAGDLNCWGPPLRILLRGLHDVVDGPTWPAWHPHSRIDHILATDRALVVDASVQPDAGSDHLPIRATFELRAK